MILRRGKIGIRPLDLSPAAKPVWVTLRDVPPSLLTRKGISWLASQLGRPTILNTRWLALMWPSQPSLATQRWREKRPVTPRLAKSLPSAPVAPPSLPVEVPPSPVMAPTPPTTIVLPTFARVAI
ncbi:hypothetical protein LINGRAHAP2_LOCUS20305 [Linum grandiflorum]